MVRNPLGSAHPEATLKACIEHGAPDDAIQAAKAEFHAYLAANRSAQAASSHDLVEDSELLSEDREMDSDSQGTVIKLICMSFRITSMKITKFTIKVFVIPYLFIIVGPINISTTAVLVSPGVSVSGTVSITSSEVYFEVDEEHPDFKRIDNQVRHLDNTNNSSHLSLNRFAELLVKLSYLIFKIEFKRINKRIC